MRIDMIEIDGFEADDIIGTVAAAAEREGLRPLIITGDRDALQLATDVTKIIFTKRGITEFEVYDRQAMIERYGLTPQQFIDLKGLMGDSSDNIPGIPGVGEKTATKLLLEYGSVENIIASVDSMKKSKLREKIEENAQLAVMSKRLATINTNVPLDIDFEEPPIRRTRYGTSHRTVQTAGIQFVSAEDGQSVRRFHVGKAVRFGRKYSRKSGQCGRRSWRFRAFHGERAE